MSYLHLMGVLAMMDMARESARRRNRHSSLSPGARLTWRGVPSRQIRRLQARLGAWLVVCGKGLQARAGQMAEAP